MIFSGVIFLDVNAIVDKVEHYRKQGNIMNTYVISALLYVSEF